MPWPSRSPKAPGNWLGELGTRLLEAGTEGREEAEGGWTEAEGGRVAGNPENQPVAKPAVV